MISTEFSRTPCVMNLRESSESILRNVGRFSGDIRLAVCLTDKIFAALSRSEIKIQKLSTFLSLGLSNFGMLSDSKCFSFPAISPETNRTAQDKTER